MQPAKIQLVGQGLTLGGAELHNHFLFGGIEMHAGTQAVLCGRMSRASDLLISLPFW